MSFDSDDKNNNISRIKSEMQRIRMREIERIKESDKRYEIAFPYLCQFLADDQNNLKEEKAIEELKNIPCNTETFEYSYLVRFVSRRIGVEKSRHNKAIEFIVKMNSARYNGLGCTHTILLDFYDCVFDTLAELRGYLLIDGETCGDMPKVTAYEWSSRRKPYPFLTDNYDDLIFKLSFNIKGIRTNDKKKQKRKSLIGEDGVSVAKEAAFYCKVLLKILSDYSRLSTRRISLRFGVWFGDLLTVAQILGKIKSIVNKTPQGGQIDSKDDDKKMAVVAMCHHGKKNYLDGSVNAITRNQLFDSVYKYYIKNMMEKSNGDYIKNPKAAVNTMLDGFENIGKDERNRYLKKYSSGQDLAADDDDAQSESRA